MSNESHTTPENIAASHDRYKTLRERFEIQEKKREALNIDIKVKLNERKRIEDEAVKAYGTSDPAKLQDLLDEWDTENHELLNEFEKSLNDQEVTLKKAQEQLDLLDQK